MEVQLTAEQEALIRQAVESGRYKSAEDAVRDAIARWEEEERDRAELIASLAEADAEIEAGLGIELTAEELPAFFEEIKREAKAMLETRRR